MRSGMHYYVSMARSEAPVVPTPRKALMELFLAVTGYYMQRPTTVKMSQELVDDLKRWHAIAHDDSADHKAALMQAYEKFTTPHAVSADPDVAAALRQARVALVVQHRDVSQRDTQRLVAR